MRPIDTPIYLHTSPALYYTNIVPGEGLGQGPGPNGVTAAKMADMSAAILHAIE